MNPKDKKFVMAGLAICIIIAVLSPFIASSNPDGLEKTAEDISTTQESNNYNAPMSDYMIPLLGEDNPYGGVLALIIGILITLAIAYVAAVLLRRKKPESLE
ncbi:MULTISPECIES: PDGLE domain-containing protein [Methanobacterium]|jgi:cobalt/nickel transport protein|uniref:Cobalt ABC transporter permease n=1 Tax=Methanobacterium bryantii TaxID=2161 RepID=A0A2A2H366_METBR|nr:MULTISPECIES: PDGLE domain-containing protein [Methanobacterium]OEC86016.1 cobalt ABC transporter permease [Methanobacterium sp. A39]PAV03736.1 cobalt ABC transporter permease [Methanobacterium bryantii]